MVSKEEILSLIQSLDKKLELHDDPVYIDGEKEAIKRFEKLALELYMDFKKDGYITLKIPEQEQVENERIIKFTKIAGDISNKLVNTRELTAAEQWFVLLSLYCWWCEMIKNLLYQVAEKIDGGSKGRKWERKFMTMGPFIRIMNEYKNRKYSGLFSDIDVDLRNSFDHGRIDFPNNEVIYHCDKGMKQMNLEELLSRFKKLPPLYACLFSSRLKPFRAEIHTFAKEKGFLNAC